MLFAVHNYSNEGEANALSMSGCYVQVYRGNNLIRTFQCPSNIQGRIWNVFRYNASTNQITPINTIGDTYAPSSNSSGVTGHSSEQDDFRDSIYEMKEKESDVSSDEMSDVSSDETSDVLSDSPTDNLLESSYEEDQTIADQIAS